MSEFNTPNEFEIPGEHNPENEQSFINAKTRDILDVAHQNTAVVAGGNEAGDVVYGLLEDIRTLHGDGDRLAIKVARQAQTILDNKYQTPDVVVDEHIGQHDKPDWLILGDKKRSIYMKIQAWAKHYWPLRNFSSIMITTEDKK